MHKYQMQLTVVMQIKRLNINCAVFKELMQEKKLKFKICNCGGTERFEKVN